MSPFKLLSFALLAFAGMASAHMFMGAASFGWPPARIWNQTAENIAPCGSSEEPGDRINFTYYKGHVLLLTQAKVWNLKLAVSHYSHPKSNDHFKSMMPYASISELDAGITCINVPDAPMLVKAGHPATLQLKYVSNYGSPFGNKTFYRCADITYAKPTDVEHWVPCFNTTDPKVNYTSPIHANYSSWEPLKGLGPDKPKLPVWARWVAGFGIPFAVLILVALVCNFLIKPLRARRFRAKSMQQVTI